MQSLQQRLAAAEQKLQRLAHLESALVNINPSLPSLIAASESAAQPSRHTPGQASLTDESFQTPGRLGTPEHEADEEAAEILERLALARARVLGGKQPLPVEELAVRICPCSCRADPYDVNLEQARRSGSNAEGMHSNDATCWKTSILSSRLMRRLPLDPLADITEAPTNVTISSVLSVLPSKAVCDTILAHYFQKVDWHWHVHHRPAFLAEYDLFWRIWAESRQDEIDPMWLAVLFAVSF